MTWTFAAHHTQHKDMNKTLTAYLHSNKEGAEWLALLSHTVHTDNIIQQLLTQQFSTWCPSARSVGGLESCSIVWTLCIFLFTLKTAEAKIRMNYSVTEWVKTFRHMMEEYCLKNALFPWPRMILYILSTWNHRSSRRYRTNSTFLQTRTWGLNQKYIPPLTDFAAAAYISTKSLKSQIYCGRREKKKGISWQNPLWQKSWSHAGLALSRDL